MEMNGNKSSLDFRLLWDAERQPFLLQISQPVTADMARHPSFFSASPFTASTSLPRLAEGEPEVSLLQCFHPFSDVDVSTGLLPPSCPRIRNPVVSLEAKGILYVVIEL